MKSRPGDTESATNRAWLDSRGLGSRRLRFSAFGVSIAVHVVAILLYTSVMQILGPDGAVMPLPSDASSDQGIPVIQLIEIDPSDDPEQPEDPEEIEEVVSPEAEARPPFIPGIPVGELVPPGLTAAERLRPVLTDRRLWADLPAEFFELPLDEQEELLLSARIVEWYDSLALAGAAEDRLTDWTFRDGGGGRWGVADGKIYLGDIALPLPLNFGVPVGKRDETARLLWEFEEIQRQSQRWIIEETWKERAAAIRARRDRERAAALPDTTRSR